VGEVDAIAPIALAPELQGHACTSRTCACVEAYRRVAACQSFDKVMPKFFFDGVLFEDIFKRSPWDSMVTSRATIV